MSRLLVVGGSGFIGQHLCYRLVQLGWQPIVLCRNSQRAASVLPKQVTLITGLEQLSKEQAVDVLINLAGEPIADRRWTVRRKQQLVVSRIGMTQKLYDFFEHRENKPQVVISGSAVGYYGGGMANDQKIAEDGAVEPNFSHQLCAGWERAASQFQQLGSRVCYLRTGIVLGEQGALAKMLPAFKFGMGGTIGNGNQWMPWIHIEDMVGIILHCIDNSDLQGAVNGTAPQPVTNLEFTKILGAVLKRPVRITMPSAVVKLLFGQMGEELLLQGQRVIPQKLQQQGYQFKYTDLHGALSQILKV